MINNNELDVSKFKELFPQLEWVKVPRVLTQDFTDYFFIGTYDTEERKVTATLRPSKRLQIIDTSKKLDKAGKDPGENYNQRYYSFSTSVEIVVDDKFIEEVRGVAKEQPKQTSQKLSWD